MNQSPPVEPSPWLTTQQAADRAHCGLKAIYTAVKRHRLKAARVGGGFRIHVTWLDAWLDAEAEIVNPEAPGKMIPLRVRRAQ